MQIGGLYNKLLPSLPFLTRLSLLNCMVAEGFAFSTFGALTTLRYLEFSGSGASPLFVVCQRSIPMSAVDLHLPSVTLCKHRFSYLMEHLRAAEAAHPLWLASTDWRVHHIHWGVILAFHRSAMTAFAIYASFHILLHRSTNCSVAFVFFFLKVVVSPSHSLIVSYWQTAVADTVGSHAQHHSAC